MNKIKTLSTKVWNNKGLILTAVLASVALGAIKSQVYDRTDGTETV